MHRIPFVAGVLSLLAALLAPAGATYVEKTQSREVILISPESPEVVELQKALWTRGEPVADIYGKPVDKKIRVVRPDPRDVIVPEEDSSITLMLANSPRHPLQMQSVWVAVKYGAPAAAFAGVVLMGAGLWWKRRRRLKTVAPAA